MNIQPFFGPFPVIDLGNIVLREISEEDAPAYLAYMNNDHMVPFLTQETMPQNLEAAKGEVNYWGSLFPSKRSIYWAIALKDTNKMIGTAGFNSISFANSRAEISYDLDPAYWGKGIMLQSIKSILKFVDYTMGIIRIQATVVVNNERSIALLERCGFQKEGLLRKYEVVQGELRDYYMYARVL